MRFKDRKDRYKMERLFSFKQPLLLVLLFLLVFGLAPTAKALDVEKDLPRLLTEAPSSDLFNKTEGLILLREIKYNLAADGSMERTTFLVVEEVTRLSEVWPELEITPPEGGKLEILEASLFRRDTFKKALPLLPASAFGERETPVLVRIPNSLNGNVMVLGFKQIWPRRVNIEDRVDLSLSLPQWEQRVIVEIPKGSNFYWKTVGVDAPTMEKGTLKDRYEWTLIDSSSKKWNSVFVNNEPVIVFSMREGTKRALESGYEYLRNEAKRLLPEYAEGNARKFKGAEVGLKVLSDLNSKILKSLDISGALPTGYLFEKGKLTPWQATGLAWKLLEQIGWKVSIFFLPAVGTKDEVPGTLALWEAPIIHVVPPGGKDFFYKFGQFTSPGIVTPELYGRTILGLRDGEIINETIDARPTKKHKLSFLWNLSLESDGRAEGVLSIKASGAWVSDLLEKGLTEEGIKKFLEHVKFRNVPGIDLRGAKIESKGLTFNIDLPVNVNIGIANEGRLLLRWPMVFMPWQEELANMKESVEIKHPFVFEQSLKLRLPEGYKVLTLPNVKSYEKEGISFIEDIKVRDKGLKLEGGTKLIVSRPPLSEEKLDVLRALMTRYARWQDLTVPLQKKP